MAIERKSRTKVLRKSSLAPERIEVCLIVSSMSEIKLTPCSGMNLTCSCIEVPFVVTGVVEVLALVALVGEREAVIVQVSGGVAFFGGLIINRPEK